MPIRNVVVILLALVVSVACYRKAPQSRYLRTITHAMGIVHDYYVRDVEERQLFEDAMKGMVGGLDQYSSFIGTESFQQFQESLDQEFGGIGIMVEGPPRTDRLTVVTPVVNTPAYHAGLQSGDVILEIDGETTEGMRLDQAVGRMRGPRGEPVQIVVKHPGREEPQSYRLTRDLIPIESVLGDTRKPDGSWNYFLEHHPRIGYVRVTSFGEHTVRDLNAALESLQENPDIQALIIDLRGNAGGLLGAAVETCDMFIDRGDIVSTRGRGGVVRQSFSASSSLQWPTHMPMVVLVNHSSASASEIVAACLKDNDRAAIVGQRTWGKGTVQNIIELEGGRSALKLTTASYWRPNGHNIHRLDEDTDEDEWGVRPSEGMEVKLENEEARVALFARRLRDVVTSRDNAPQSDEPPEDDQPASGDDPPNKDAPQAPDKASENDAPEASDQADAGVSEDDSAGNADDSAGNEDDSAGNEDDSAGNEDVPAGSEDDPDVDPKQDPTVVDPQLRKAVEYLDSKLTPLSS